MKIVESYCFHQDELATKYLEFSDSTSRSYVLNRIKDNTYYFIFTLVIKKMIADELDYDDILKYIKRLACLYCYYSLTKEKKEELKVTVFDTILESPITYDVLAKKVEEPDKSDAFAYAYTSYYNNHNSGSSKNYSFILKTIKEYASKKAGHIERVLRNDQFFFTPDTNMNVFKGKEELKRFDLLLAECYADPSLIHFDFEIVDRKEFEANISPEDDESSKINGSWYSYAVVYYGYYINQFIEEGCNIKDIDTQVLLGATMDKNFRKGCAVFAKKEEDKYIFENYDYSLIQPFRFKYNGKLYLYKNQKVEEI